MEIQFEMNPTVSNREELSLAEAEMKKYRAWEEDFWKQKARMKWFNDGDRNTRFFHNYVKGIRKRFAIHEIHTSQGDIINNTLNIGVKAVCYFEK